jgi:hypothetical protein
LTVTLNLVAYAIMKMKISLVLAVIGVAVVVSGCVATVDGHTRAAFPFRKDKITASYEIAAEKVFPAVKPVLMAEGVVQGENTINMSYVAKVNTRIVYVKVDKVQDNLCHVIVQVRTKMGGTDIDLAAEVDKKIALALTQIPH